jgi:hypothetical protein
VQTLIGVGNFHVHLKLIDDKTLHPRVMDGLLVKWIDEDDVRKPFLAFIALYRNPFVRAFELDGY